MTTPDGVEWEVGRRLSSRFRRHSFAWWRQRANFLEGDAAQGAFAFDGGLEEGVIILVVLVALALVIIPLLLFGIELIILGVLLALGLLARVALRRPWLVEARIVAGAPQRICEWQIVGWRRSDAAIATIAGQLASGLEPNPETGLT